MARRDDLWLRELYQAQWAPMVQLAAALTGSATGAANLVQDALVTVHLRRDHFETLAQAEAYLRVAVLNRTRTAPRTHDPRPDQPPGLALVEALPQRQREVLVLRHQLGLGDPDIAATLGISRRAVSSHGHRGLLAVGAALSPSDEHDPAGQHDPAAQRDPAAPFDPAEPFDHDARFDPATEGPPTEPLEDDGATAEAITAALRDSAGDVEVPERLAEVLAAAVRADRAQRAARIGRGRFGWLVLAAVLALVVGLALPVLVPGFSLLGRTPAQVPTPTTTPVLSPHVPPSLPTLQRDLPIYYVGADKLLYREFRDLPTQDDRLSTAVGAVLNVAPLDPGYSSLWAGGQVNSATVVGSRIVIDISASAFATFTSREVADAAINQVVYTAIGAVGDQTGERTVQILIDGSPNLPVIGTPTTDFTKHGTTPLGLLWILTPEPVTPQPAGEITLRGYQQVVLTDTIIRWQVLDADEKVVREGTVAATGNDQGWRYWVAAVILPAGDYELRVWTNQAPEQRRHFTVA